MLAMGLLLPDWIQLTEAYLVAAYLVALYPLAVLEHPEWLRQALEPELQGSVGRTEVWQVVGV